VNNHHLGGRLGWVVHVDCHFNRYEPIVKSVFIGPSRYNVCESAGLGEQDDVGTASPVCTDGKTEPSTCRPKRSRRYSNTTWVER
jgi:hypothetical protein